jgi:hypothetical protein
MPNKFNAKCRHHIPKMKCTVHNWAEYDAALRARGSLTLWVTAEAMDHWTALPRSTPDGQCFYSDLAIEATLMLRLVFRQPLRQTEGLMACIFELVGVDLKAPDHSTVSRRAMNLELISKRCTLPEGTAHILIDSTELKVFGAGEWLLETHGQNLRRSWRKPHLAVDANTGLIVASTLTEQVVMPPRVTAQPSAQFETNPSTRDTHPLMIQSLGRLDWQEATGYGHSARWWRPPWVATKPSSDHGRVRATGMASRPKQPSRRPPGNNAVSGPN